METPEVAEGRVRFLDLGELTVRVGERERSPGGARLTAILAVLLVHANRRVPVDTLSAAIWHDGRPRTASTLESHVWRLRRVLEPDRRPGEASALLVTEPGGYRLTVTPGQVDSWRFADLVDDAASLLAGAQPVVALQRCHQALALWRGRPLAPVADQPWAAPTVARLEELRAQLGECQVDALLALGRPEQALAALESALAEHPLRERLWARRMLAAHRAGRTDDALAAYARARSLLVAELGTEPSEELREMHRRVLAVDPTLRPDPIPAATLSPLPRRSGRLVGRVHELERTGTLVRHRSPVTLSGPAGVGKTRLAVEVADDVAPAFPDGVRFVDLSGARGGAQVLDTVATVIGLPVDALRGLRALLVLDDCEHVLVEVADLVARLRRTAPELGLLVTSREPLNLENESVVEVAPLTVPDEHRPGAAALDLFLDRWEADAGPVDPDHLEHARRVCRAVEGVPLALELAAARARTFTLAEVAEQTERDPGALSGPGRGGRTGRPGSRGAVHAAVERSHLLLDADAQLLHRRLAVLPGPFTVRAAAAVAGIDRPVTADLLVDMTHRSMIVARGPQRSAGPSRFAQLTIVRAHAARCLADADDVDTVRDARDAWVHRVIVQDRPRLGTPEEQAWSEALADDLAALRATLARALVDRPSELGVEIVAGLGTMFWYQRDATVEGGRWTELADTLTRREPAVAPRFVRAQATLWSAALRAFAGRVDLAAPLCDRGLDDLAHDLGDAPPDRALAVGDGLVVLWTCLWLAGASERARRVLDTTTRILERTADPTLALLMRMTDAMTGLGRRAPDDVLGDAAATYRDARAVDNRFAAWVSAGIAQMAALAGGDAETALSWSDLCLQAIERTGRREVPLQLELRANTLTALGRCDEALRLYGAARSHNRRAGVPWPSMPGTDDLLERARAAIPPSTAEQRLRDDVHLTVRDLLGAS